jgi:CRISPR-associated endonuclease/helicase Cas3
MDDLNASYFKYWGKADKDDPTKYHLLSYHCLDVAAVGWILLDPSESLCVRLSAQLEVEPGWLRDFFVFCLTLHDIGKFSRTENRLF